MCKKCKDWRGDFTAHVSINDDGLAATIKINHANTQLGNDPAVPSGVLTAALMDVAQQIEFQQCARDAEAHANRGAKHD